MSQTTSPVKSYRQQQSFNASNTLSGTKQFFEEVKQKLYPHEQVLLMKEFLDTSASPTKGFQDGNNEFSRTNTLDQTTDSAYYFQQTPGKEIQDLLKKFCCLDCSIHKIRQYDHICSSENCEQNKILYCSQCLLEDENHTRLHKSQFKPLEQYLPQKIDNLSGETQSKRVRRMMKDIIQLKDELDSQEQELCNRIESDFNEIEQNVKAYCQLIKENLFTKVKQNTTDRTKDLKSLLVLIQEQEQVLWKEQEEILKDFKNILTQNFNYNDLIQVNAFARKVRAKTNRFTIDPHLQLGDEKIACFRQQEAESKISSYNTELLEKIKKTIYDALQQPFANEQYIDFAPKNFKVETGSRLMASLRGTGISLPNSSSIFEPCFDDKKICINQMILFGCDQQQNNTETVKNVQNLVKYSLQNEIVAQTTHKMAINSIAVIDTNTFACVSNDAKLKIWGITPTNLVLHERASVDQKDLCLSLKYYEPKKYLLCGMSHPTIEMYDISQDITKPQLIRTFEGHERTVRQISLLPKQNGFATISYDEKLKFWNFEQSSAQVTFNYSTDVRVMDSNDNFVVLGCNKDSSIMVFEIEAQYSDRSFFKNFKFKGQVKNVTQVNQVTCVSLFQKAYQLVLCGAHSGLISLVDLQTSQILKRFDSHKNRVFSINPIEVQIPQNYISPTASKYIQPGFELSFISTSWDGKIIVTDIQSGQQVTNTSYVLANDKKKHWNTDGTKLISTVYKPPQKDSQVTHSGGSQDYRLFSIGNDDRRVQVFKLSISHN
ncbi:WD domain, G-beta repeat protein (macronuclear) [Tetrahymena thermophila SB210]|uniref:WD domain, G-beta repeat protein n=1 Tax=Tetrahymena thermophila (strain SB210) TaxID=312017 RepID=I7MMN1_TETTS|nr:WD domain, G-beta repeat protein [Tetrahymena thermophila SB210]EAS06009.1 WD domain, G-beta repeat protein [Tetrahymena thermophila SB210]|eukprot:XP_001026254.1 WD domain, G-beta repeat protein [Tetrahymena thermophila SB210]